MTDLAQQLILNENCGQDFVNQQPLVLQAYNGLIAYEAVYRATCLKISADNQYCFSKAVSTSNNSADIYPYLTAIGLNMPAGSKPTCSACLKQTMAIYPEYAVRAEHPLAETYLSCAKMVDDTCGQSFADLGVQVGSVSNGMANAKQGGQGSGAGRLVSTTSGMAAVVAGLAVGLISVIG
jgi:hypothetical protein